MASSQFNGNMPPQYMRNNFPTEDALSREMSGMSLSNNHPGLQYGTQDPPNKLNPDAIEFRSGRANHFTKELMRDMGGRSSGGGKKSRRHRQYKERVRHDLSPSIYQPQLPAGHHFEPPNFDRLENAAPNLPGDYIRGRDPHPQGYPLHGPNPMQGQHQMPYYGNPVQGGNMHQASVPGHVQYQNQGWNQRPGPIPNRGQPFPMFMEGSYQRQQH